MCFVNYVLVLYKLAFANRRFSCCKEETNVSYCDIFFFLPVCLLFLAAGIFKPLHLLPFTG